MPRKPPPEHSRWQPGQSGNPAGYSRNRRITAALGALIEDEKAGQPLARVWLNLALSGDPKFFSMLLDRIEGKVPDVIESAGPTAGPYTLSDDRFDPDPDPDADDGDGLVYGGDGPTPDAPLPGGEVAP